MNIMGPALLFFEFTMSRITLLSGCSSGLSVCTMSTRTGLLARLSQG